MHCNSYSHFCSININVFENTLATTVNKFVINKLVKLTVLWTSGPEGFKLTSSAPNPHTRFKCCKTCKKTFGSLTGCLAHAVKHHRKRCIMLNQSWNKEEYGTSVKLHRRWQTELKKTTTVLLTSLGKTFFAWCFILNENILFWLTISYLKPFVCSVSVFDSQVCTLKLNLRPKIGLTYAISIVKWFFGIFVLGNIFFTFLCWIWITDVSQQHCENFRKNEQVELVENLPLRHIPYRFLHYLLSFLLWEQVKIFDFLKKQWLE